MIVRPIQHKEPDDHERHFIPATVFEKPSIRRFTSASTQRTLGSHPGRRRRHASAVDDAHHYRRRSPKQFVPVIGGSTLLDQTRSRVALSVLPGRTLFVVTEKHRRFYQSLTQSVSPNLLLEQPANKGTAPAILYALMRVAAKSPKAIVALFPSDHYFADDEEFMSHVDAAFDAVQAQPTRDLCWYHAERPETEYGWIEPQRSILGSLPAQLLA
jgi:hypothetical protein